MWNYGGRQPSLSQMLVGTSILCLFQKLKWVIVTSLDSPETMQRTTTTTKTKTSKQTKKNKNRNKNQAWWWMLVISQLGRERQAEPWGLTWQALWTSEKAYPKEGRKHEGWHSRLSDDFHMNANTHRDTHTRIQRYIHTYMYTCIFTYTTWTHTQKSRFGYLPGFHSAAK